MVKSNTLWKEKYFFNNNIALPNTLMSVDCVFSFSNERELDRSQDKLNTQRFIT